MHVGGVWESLSTMTLRDVEVLQTAYFDTS